MATITVRVTVTAVREYEVDPSEFADGDDIPEGSDLDECIEASVADDIGDFIDGLDDLQIKVEQIEMETPQKESL